MYFILTYICKTQSENIMQATEQEQFETLNSILSEAKEKANYIDDGRLVLELRLKTNNQTDTEIFIRKGFNIWGYRCFGNNLLTFFNRWGDNHGQILTREGLLNKLIIMLK